MAPNGIQFHKGFSLPEIQLFGTEEHCEAALEKKRWPVGILCSRGGHDPAACIPQLKEAAELDGDDAPEDPGGAHPGHGRRHPEVAALDPEWG